MSLTPKETTDLLRDIGHQPKKQLGQNFLIDGNIVRKSIEMADLPEGLPVVEIGPGLGTLTRRLLQAGHPVHAVEIDHGLLENLERSLSPEIGQGRLSLQRADAVKSPLGTLPEGIDEYAVVANLPYAISSAWLESLLATGRLPLRMVLMLQKEALDRMWADCGTKNYNALSIFLRASFESGTRHLVSRQCFYPVPGVNSVLARMNRLPSPFLFADPTRALIRKIFTRRRKQIGSLAKMEEAREREEILTWLESEGIRPTLRPEHIEPQAWLSLGRQD